MEVKMAVGGHCLRGLMATKTAKISRFHCNCVRLGIEKPM